MIDAADELVQRGPGVRVFGHDRRPGFADCGPSGRMRLDALACWLQDVAYDDVEDAGLHGASIWVVRRSRIRVNRFPRFGERFALSTFCSGLGRMWAQRRTDIVRHGESGPEPVADVQAVSLWVHLDPEWRPSPLSEVEVSTYVGTERPRRVSARLRHPTPGSALDSRGWTFRATECDIADHINNAAYWAPLEAELLAGEDPGELDAEIEYRIPAQPGAKRVLARGPLRWIVGEDAELHASVLIRSRDGTEAERR